jgi:hypothetical protein
MNHLNLRLWTTTSVFKPTASSWHTNSITLCSCTTLEVPDLSLVGSSSFWADGGYSTQVDYEHFSVVDTSTTDNHHDDRGNRDHDEQLPESGRPHNVTTGQANTNSSSCSSNKKRSVLPFLVLKRARFPTNFFIGNGAVICPGNHPTNFLVGVIQQSQWSQI